MRKAGRSPTAAAPEEPSRAQLVDEAHDRLREMIVSGRLAPGAPIIETEVAGVLQISRTHLRSALQRLRETGFVVSSPIGAYSRSKVAPLTLDDVGEVFRIVGAIEGLAARSAAELPGAERSALVQEMREINSDLQAAAAPPDFKRAYQLDLDFHRCYVEGAGGERVKALYASIKPQADRYERLYTNALIDQTDGSVAEHERIIQAIEDGDPDSAEHAAETNWRNAADRFRTMMAVVGERGSMHPTPGGP